MIETSEAPAPEPAAEKQKISEWLADCGSHDIYHLGKISADFVKCTGQPWPEYIGTSTVRETRAAIQARGLGGSIEGDPLDRVVWGYAMAEDFARQLIQFSPFQEGRGSRFWACIDALRARGL